MEKWREEVIINKLDNIKSGDIIKNQEIESIKRLIKNEYSEVSNTNIAIVKLISELGEAQKQINDLIDASNAQKISMEMMGNLILSLDKDIKNIQEKLSLK